MQRTTTCCNDRMGLTVGNAAARNEWPPKPGVEVEYLTLCNGPLQLLEQHLAAPRVPFVSDYQTLR